MKKDAAKYKVSPKGKRKLDFPAKMKKASVKLPLVGKNVFLDVKELKHKKRLQADLKRLGATVEEFISKDIHYLITTQPRPRVKKDGRDDSPAPSPFNCDPSPSPGTTDEQRAPTVTRGKALAERARVNSRETNNVLNTAEKWGVKIVGLETAYRWIDKELRKLPKSAQHTEKVAQKPKCIAKYKLLEAPYIKFESSNLFYRPINQHLDVWPSLNVDTPRGSCPFDGTLLRGDDKSKEERGDILAAQVDIPTDDTPKEEKDGMDSNTPKPGTDKPTKKSEIEGYGSNKVLTAGELRRRKELKRRQERKKGYCECCKIKYEDLDKHVREEQHRLYVKEKSNYQHLDSLIGSVQSTAEFLKKCILSSVMKTSQSDTSKRYGKDVNSISSTPKKVPPASPGRNISSTELICATEEKRINLSCLNKAYSSMEERVEKENKLSDLKKVHSSKDLNDSKRIDIKNRDSSPKQKETGNSKHGSDTKENIFQGQRRSPRKLCGTVVENEFKLPPAQLSTAVLKSPLKPLNKVRQSPRKTNNPFKSEQIEELKPSGTAKGQSSPKNINIPLSSSQVHVDTPGKVSDEIGSNNLSSDQQGKVVLESAKTQSDGHDDDKDRKDKTESAVTEVLENKSIKCKVDVTRMENSLLKTCKRTRTGRHGLSDDFKTGLVQSLDAFDDKECREIDLNGSGKRILRNMVDIEVNSIDNTAENCEVSLNTEEEIVSSKKSKGFPYRLAGHRKSRHHLDSSSEEERKMNRADGDIKKGETYSNDGYNSMKVDKQTISPRKVSSSSKRKDDLASSREQTRSKSTTGKTESDKNYFDKHLHCVKAGLHVRSCKTQRIKKSADNIISSKKPDSGQDIVVKSEDTPSGIAEDEVVNSDVPTDFQSYGPQGEFMIFSKTLAERIKERGNRRSSVPSYNLNLISQTLSSPHCDLWGVEVSKSHRKEKSLHAHPKISPTHNKNSKTSAVVASKKICSKYRQKRNTNHKPEQLAPLSGYQGDDEGETKNDRKKISSGCRRKRETKKYWFYELEPDSSSTNCDDEKLKSLPKEVQSLQAAWNDVTDTTASNNTRKLRRSAIILPENCEDSDNEDRDAERCLRQTLPDCEAKKVKMQKKMETEVKPRRTVRKSVCTVVNSDVDSNTDNEFKSFVKGSNTLEKFAPGKLQEIVVLDYEDSSQSSHIDFTDSECASDSFISKNCRKTVRNTETLKEELQNKTLYKKGVVKETSTRKTSRERKVFWEYVVESSCEENDVDDNVPKALRCLKSSWNNLADMKNTDNSRTSRSGTIIVNKDLGVDKEARVQVESENEEEVDESIPKETKHVKSSWNDRTDVKHASAKHRSRSEHASGRYDNDSKENTGKKDSDVKNLDHKKITVQNNDKFSEEIDQSKFENSINEKPVRKAKKVFWEYVIETESESEEDNTSIPKMVRDLKSPWNNLSDVRNTTVKRKSRLTCPVIYGDSECQSRNAFEKSNNEESKPAGAFSENKEGELAVDERIDISISNVENLVMKSGDEVNQIKQQAKRQKTSGVYSQNKNHQDILKSRKIEYDKKKLVTDDSLIVDSREAKKNSKHNKLKIESLKTDVSSALTKKYSQKHAKNLEIEEPTEQSYSDQPGLDDENKVDSTKSSKFSIDSKMHVKCSTELSNNKDGDRLSSTDQENEKVSISTQCKKSAGTGSDRKSKTRRIFWEYVPVTSPDKSDVIDKNLNKEILGLRDEWNNLRGQVSSEKSKRLLRGKSIETNSFTKRATNCSEKENQKDQTGENLTGIKNICATEEDSKLSKDSVKDVDLICSDDKIPYSSDTVEDERIISSVNVIDVDNSKLQLPLKQVSCVPELPGTNLNIEKSRWNDEQDKNSVFNLLNTEDKSETEIDIRSSSPVFNKSPVSKIHKNHCVGKNIKPNKEIVSEERKRQRISKAIRDKIKIHNEEPVRKPSPVIELSPTKYSTPAKTDKYVIVSSPHSGYSTSPREQRRRQWKRKAQDGTLDSSNSDLPIVGQSTKRRKLDKLKYVIDKTNGVVSPKRSRKSPRKLQVVQNAKSPIKSDQQSVVTGKAKGYDNNAPENTSTTLNVSLKWQPVTLHSEDCEDNKKVKLNKSWSLISDRSASKLLSSDDDKDSFTGFTKDDVDQNNSLPSDISFEEHSEVDIDNTKYEWSVEDETGNNDEDLSKLVPTFSSPGKPSEPDWELNVDSFMKNRVNDRHELCMSMTSPWRGSRSAASNLDNNSSVHYRRTPVKNKRQSFMSRINQADNECEENKPDWEKVDEEVEFNHRSPQKLCSDFSPLRAVNGVILGHSRKNITSTPAIKQKKSKKSLDKSFSGLVFCYDNENADDSGTDVERPSQDYRLLKKKSDVKKSFSIKYDASPQKKPRKKKS